MYTTVTLKTGKCYLVSWSPGLLVLRSAGLLVLRSSGLAVFWSTGLLVNRSLVFLSQPEQAVNYKLILYIICKSE
jgi:hypothetical protein